MQVNLQKKQLATDEAFIEAARLKVTAVLIQEPYVGAIRRLKSYSGVRVYQNAGHGEGMVKSAIAIFDSTLDVIQYPQLTTNNIVVVGIRTSAWQVTLVSVYFEGDKPLEPYVGHLDEIVRAAGRKRLIVGGDVNSWNTWWGSVRTDHRGEDLLYALDNLELRVLNNSDELIPTFDTVRGETRYTSHVDVTACSVDMLPLVDGWKVVENLTSSDHNGITFDILLNKSQGTHITRTTRIYNTKKANWSQFHTKLDQLKEEHNFTHTSITHISNTTHIDSVVNTFTQLITQTCTHTIPIRKNKNTLTMPWWSEKLEKLKREVTTRRRRVRCAAPVRRAGVVAKYLEKKREYELEASKAKTDSWKEFCGKQDRETMWDSIYRVIGRTKSREEDLLLRAGGRDLNAEESVKLLAETFYPEDTTENENEEHRETRAKADKVNHGQQFDNCDPPFTLAELYTAADTFNPRKAPGMDGFTADICKEVVKNDPKLYLAILNKCLQHSYFPKLWKEATVVILRKPGKDTYTAPKSYRPIGLLSVLGKIFEKMLIARIKFHIVPRTSTRQFGFMPQRSTEDALYILMQHIHKKLSEKRIITLVSLDIEGAFDSAWWPAIRVRLAEEKCPVNLRRVVDSYLQNRKVRVRYAGEEFEKRTNKGCVQGSIGGPTLWNVLLDPLLKDLEREGHYIQAFADDVVLAFDGYTALEIERHANAALERVRAWGIRNKLKFAPHKTTAMVITRKLKFDTPRLRMDGVDIGMSNEMKLLGLTIDRKLTFNSHAVNVCRKAQSFYKQLERAAKVNWGLSPEVLRTIYIAVVEPTIMYAASAWASATRKITIKNQLDTVQRGFVQKIIKAYRTVSLNSALLLAGLLPLDIRVREAALLYEIRKGHTRRIVGDREIEAPEPYTTLPHPAMSEILSFTCLPDGAAFDQSFRDGINIFTDGSRIQGKVGAALSVREGAEEISTRKLKLGECCSVYQAELLALVEATDRAWKYGRPESSIYCDSRSALEAVTNAFSLHPLVLQIRKNISKINEDLKILRLFWIKAHVGMEGNERADELAKSAALQLKTKPNYNRCPISYIKREIREESIGEWQGRYEDGKQASVTKIFFPDVRRAHRLIRKMVVDPISVQMLTGHGGFSAYLHRFKCKESPACPCDPDKEESALHVIVECPIYGRQRYDVEHEIGVYINMENMHKIMEDNIIRNKFIEYCKLVINSVVRKNK